jgi:hypothetical protein
MGCCFVVFRVLCYSKIGFVFFIIFKVIVIETLTHLFLVSFTGGTLQQSKGFGSDFKFSEAVKAPHGSNIFVSSPLFGFIYRWDIAAIQGLWA